MDTTRELSTVLAFCAGYAGIERGLDLAGVDHRVVAYVEVEAFAVANLVQKMEAGALDPAPIYTDLKTFPSHLFRGAVDIITGGYPCQPFSAAGKRQGADDPRHLWPFIDHHIAAVDPGTVFFENVDGHVTLGLSTVLSDLEERGYETAWGIFSAAEVGAPHQRKRVYIMGDAPGANRWAGLRQTDSEQNRAGLTGSSAVSRTGPVADAQRAGLEGHAGDGPEGVEPGRVGTQEGRPASAGGVREGDVPDTGRGGGERTWSDECFWPFAPGWCLEPDVGRVVNGCPDRVDRIRLLGNGVVPQTAAKAWATLRAELDSPQRAAERKALEILKGM